MRLFMNMNKNPKNKLDTNAYTCIPVGEYLAYYKEKGTTLTPSILYKTMTDKVVGSRDEVTALLATLHTLQEAEIRVEGKFSLDHLSTHIIPAELKVLSYSAYSVGNDHILTIQCECDHNQPIIASDNDLERHPELIEIFHAENQSDTELS